MRYLRIKAFRDDERGVVAVEGLFGTLLLVGWFIVAFQLWDAFWIRSKVTKATYTIADMLSRQTDAIGPTYVGGMKKVFDFLTKPDAANDSWLRVTLFRCKAINGENPPKPCDGTTKKFDVVKSYATNVAQPYTNATLNAEASRIPIMAAGDMAVLTETAYHYRPIEALRIGDRDLSLDNGNTWTNIGLETSRLNGLVFSSFVITRPREVRTVWDDSK